MADGKREARDADGHLVRELHGVTLAQILDYLVAHVGWDGLARQITINCFSSNPSVASSLTFLRRTPWARAKVEALYVELRSRELGNTDRAETDPAVSDATALGRRRS